MCTIRVCKGSYVEAFDILIKNAFFDIFQASKLQDSQNLHQEDQLQGTTSKSISEKQIYVFISHVQRYTNI